MTYRIAARTIGRATANTITRTRMRMSLESSFGGW
jgi:hypothetical protein